MPDSAQINPSDPHRRIRRHRYQEGPGFLFLATQNGRPSCQSRKPSLDRVRPDHIDQLFKACGCSRGAVPRPPGPRYERGRPNELWHVDLKGPFFINLGRTYIKTWIAGLVDDHSRFVIGLRILTEAKAV